MKRSLLLLLFCFGIWINAQAQILVKGRVASSSGPNEGLPGANVVIKGSSTGTTTDFDGNYTISVPDGETILSFSFIGMKTQEVKVGNQSKIDVVLELELMQLSEVVTIGYGTQKRKDITSAVATVEGEDVANTPGAYSFDGAIQGKVAGVNISTSSATPGAAINVNIRGVSSIGASSQPLYVIDGVPVVSRNNSALNQNIQPVNPLADLNPNDIESITVLKDASSTAIYGSRGANGVIIVTTKRGKIGKTKINVGYSGGIAEISNTPDMMTSKEWIEFMNAAAKFDGKGENFWNDQLGDPNDPNLPNYNPYDYIFRTAALHNADLSLQGGNDKTTVFASVNYSNQEGIQKGLSFERVSGRLNMNHSVSDKLGIGTTITLGRTNHQRTINENDEYGVVINAQAWDPTAPLLNPNGSYTNPFSYNGWWALENPLFIAEQYKNISQTTRGLGSMFFTYDFTDNITLKSVWSVDYNSLLEESFTPAGGNETAIGEGIYATYNETAWLGETTLSYSKNFNDNHDFNGILGYTLQESYTTFSDITGTGFPSNRITKITSAANTTGTASSTSFGFQSFFGRFNYSFQDKYLVSASLRADGSSRFGKDNRYGIFPSAAVGWRISNESFMAGINNTVSNLKLRGSYGITGNAEIGDFRWIGAYRLTANYNGNGGSNPDNLGNPELSWETTAQLDVGVDLGLFNRINITADYFIKNTTDLLLPRDIPGTTGFKTTLDNFGEIENKGVELSIGAEILRDSKLKWNANLTYTHVENQVINVVNDGQIISRNFIIKEGLPLSQINLIKFLGVDPFTGDAVFEDLNSDGLINLDDRQPVGSGLPTDFAGLNNSFSYKGLSLDIFFQYVGGNKIFNQSRYAYENYGSLQGSIPFGNQSARSLNYWKQPGDITDIPRPSMITANDTDAQYQRFSTQYLEDGDFIRLKNVKLSYNFPKTVTDKMKVGSLRVYAQGRNLVTWTKYIGFDPEVSTNTSSQENLNSQQGEDFGTLGQARTYTFGINIGF